MMKDGRLDGTWVELFIRGVASNTVPASNVV